MIKNIIIGVLAILVVVLGVLYFTSPKPLGATTAEYNAKEFLNTVTFTGATVFSGAESHAGVMTLTANPIIGATASSTLQVGATVTGGIRSGCIMLGLPGATTTIYLTATSTENTILATTTKPASCK